MLLSRLRPRRVAEMRSDQLDAPQQDVGRQVLALREPGIADQDDAAEAARHHERRWQDRGISGDIEDGVRQGSAREVPDPRDGLVGRSGHGVRRSGPDRPIQAGSGPRDDDDTAGAGAARELRRELSEDSRAEHHRAGAGREPRPAHADLGDRGDGEPRGVFVGDRIRDPNRLLGRDGRELGMRRVRRHAVSLAKSRDSGPGGRDPAHVAVARLKRITHPFVPMPARRKLARQTGQLGPGAHETV